MSKRRFSILILAATLFVLTAACICIPYIPLQPAAPTPPPVIADRVSAAQSATPTAAETATPSPSPSPQIACPSLLTDMLAASEGSDAPLKSPRRRLPVLQNEETLVTYQVEGDQLVSSELDSVPASLRPYQQDTAAQRAIWDYFTTIIPSDQREIVNQYIVFTDGREDILAAVEQDGDDPALWALDVDILDSSDQKALGATLLHEFGHLLTLNTSQVVTDMNVYDNPDDQQAYDQAAAACPQYFVAEGCSLPDSYINNFYQRFWPDIYAQWEQINAIEDDERRDNHLYDFYRAHRDQFVTDYAVTSPEEDIAESWTFFILDPKPAGDTIAEQKILFFYEWPELAQLRDEIISRVCTYFDQP
ncbi:SMI1/KNR4 family protein [bacterium]|nr:SMI1/KNR4 family protein [bacterium]OIO87844.1 MAG: hypothetical protein AUK02_04540 [Anaerolineae bacterium CG2_30_58_95]PIW18928.1 MAG: hypothetical protein COW33_05280 [Anaerolineae bacterium CG17_big_fil_post_rev_8_21_14_2_50_57_27]PIZ26457.1 MAG: hypothetical protein COY47_00390 [Chloroflexi bacterium CG_4_10_14_0_8_um_filter_57_5]